MSVCILYFLESSGNFIFHGRYCVSFTHHSHCHSISFAQDKSFIIISSSLQFSCGYKAWFPSKISWAVFSQSKRNRSTSNPQYSICTVQKVSAPTPFTFIFLLSFVYLVFGRLMILLVGGKISFQVISSNHKIKTRWWEWSAGICKILWQVPLIMLRYPSSFILK